MAEIRSVNKSPSQIIKFFRRSRDFLNGVLSKSNDPVKNYYNGNQRYLKGNKRLVILDGCNVACGFTNSPNFSVRGVEIALEMFKLKGHPVIAIVPENRMQNMTDDQRKFEKLVAKRKIILTPCKNLPTNRACCYDDRFMLDIVNAMDGVIVSNDNFRDLVNENSDYNRIINSRVIGFTWVEELFLIPEDPYGKHGPKLNDILLRNS